MGKRRTLATACMELLKIPSISSCICARRGNAFYMRVRLLTRASAPASVGFKYI